MKPLIPWILALFVAAAFPARAATESPAKPAAASAPAGCSTGAKPHDHAAERGSGSSLSKAARDGCGTAASSPAARSKPAHDHGKMHKQQ